MIVKHFLLDVNEANAFIAHCEQTREAMLIDAGELSAAIPDYVEAKGLRLTAIFITHDHYDHTGGLSEAVKHFGAAVYAGSPRPGGVKAKVVRQGDTLPLGKLRGAIAATPGHTPDGLSLIFPGHVFTGDALFAGSVGGTGSPELAAQQLERIRHNLFTLPGDYAVHVGHGPSTTIEIERSFNPFFV